MDIETLLLFVPIILILVIGIFFKRKLNIHVMKTVGRKIKRLWHSMPLWLRIFLLISIPYILVLIVRQLYSPDSNFDLFIPYQ